MRKERQQEAKTIILTGVVQGVGFRPFIYRIALDCQLHGWVGNSSGRVEVFVQGKPERLQQFLDTLIDSAPPLSRPVLESVIQADCSESVGFSILTSHADPDADIHLPADLFTCVDCLQELNDPADRRFRYPFINCTQCGPRYTLIEALPYDRPNTSMAGFPLCKLCNEEYTDPLKRRYHAEPVACAQCGPALTFNEEGKNPVFGNEPSLQATIEALAAGKTLAIKGIGGYHLVCDARSCEAVNHLRERKPRPHKPLAVMFPAAAGDELDVIESYLSPSEPEAQLLVSPARPIVLVRKKPGTDLSPGIAPGLNEIGAMLPYSPLHHTLLRDFGAPLVATSANLSGEPVLTENADIEQRLSHVADGYLHHDRPIVRPADDPVIRVINRQASPIRQGRGLAPVEIELPFKLQRPLLATGAQMKNTVALAWDRRIVVSPHIGEMDSLRSLQTFEQCITDLQNLYQVKAEHIVCDAHPGFTASRWARQQDLPVSSVYHHHAHASAAYVEALLDAADLDDMLVFTWDGVGLGPDDTLWGGEALLGKPGQWRQAGSFRPFRLPGGERAGREPWRSAAALCWESGQQCTLAEAADPLLFSFWQQGRNAPATSAVGRLFDAAAALTGVCTRASFEGQGPMLFEALAAGYPNIDDVPVTRLGISCKDGVCLADWATLIPVLIDESISTAERAARFHVSMADTLLRLALRLREQTGVNAIGLAGGVFQNRVLTEQAISLLDNAGFRTTMPLLVPVNDASISFGQIADHGYNKG